MVFLFVGRKMATKLGWKGHHRRAHDVGLDGQLQREVYGGHLAVEDTVLQIMQACYPEVKQVAE